MFRELDILGRWILEKTLDKMQKHTFRELVNTGTVSLNGNLGTTQPLSAKILPILDQS